MVRATSSPQTPAHPHKLQVKGHLLPQIQVQCRRGAPPLRNTSSLSTNESRNVFVISRGSSISPLKRSSGTHYQILTPLVCRHGDLAEPCILLVPGARGRSRPLPSLQLTAFLTIVYRPLVSSSTIVEMFLRFHLMSGNGWFPQELRFIDGQEGICEFHRS